MLLEVKELTVVFPTQRGVLRAVDGLTYSVEAGQCLAIIGESGSGKSVSSRAVMGTLRPPGRVIGGQVLLEGTSLLDMGASERRKVKGDQIAMVYQEALSALNPVFTVGWQIAEVYRKRRGLPRRAARDRVVDLLGKVGIPNPKSRYDNYPHQFSGGMRQRAVVAMALALEPKVLIADEPTTALDVTIQAQVLELFRALQDEYDMALILISHDLGIAANIADSVVVMYAGRGVESGPTEDVFTAPAHPYTLGLLESSPGARGGFRAIGGTAPRMTELPTGCTFHPRCKYAKSRCISDVPGNYIVPGGRAAACFYYAEMLAGELSETSEDFARGGAVDG